MNSSRVRVECPIVSTMGEGFALGFLFPTRPPVLALMPDTLTLTRLCIIGSLLLGSADLDRIIPAFGTLTFFPEKGELDHCTVRAALREQIGEPQVQRAVMSRIRPIGARPIIG